MENNFIDAENNGGSEDLSYKFIVLEQVRNITRLGSKEFHGGYYAEKIVKNGLTQKEYIEATHEAYSNAVDTLRSLLHSNFDEQMKVDDEMISKLLRTQIDSFNKYEIDIDTYKFIRANYKRQLFTALCDFLFRKKYLDGSNYDGGSI